MWHVNFVTILVLNRITTPPPPFATLSVACDNLV